VNLMYPDPNLKRSCDTSKAGCVQRRPLRPTAPSVEFLEVRRLLSFFQPVSLKLDRVRSGHAVYLIAVSGPGQVHAASMGGRGFDVKLFGTTEDSEVTISVLGTRPGSINGHLQIRKLQVRSGRVGSIQGLTTADLMGPISPLLGPVTSLQFDTIGPGAQIHVAGNLGQLTVNQSVNLGSGGVIAVANDLTGTFSVNANMTLDSGTIDIGRDLSGQLAVGGNLAVQDAGHFSVGRDLGVTGGSGAKVTGNLTLSSSGALLVGRNLISLTVGGNVDTSMGGEFEVAGTVKTFTVNGTIQGTVPKTSSSTST
jgi:hypothetical protein